MAWKSLCSVPHVLGFWELQSAGRHCFCKCRRHPCWVQSGQAVREKVGGGEEADEDVEDSENESSKDNDEKNSELPGSSLETGSISEDE